VLRKHARLLISLLLLMLGTGLPELRTAADLKYLKDRLFLSMTDDEAKAEFVKLMHQAVESKRTTLNNLIHNLTHSSTSKPKK
jgi:phosphatidylinositol-4,5-bisphosphate 3-kinase